MNEGTGRNNTTREARFPRFFFLRPPIKLQVSRPVHRDAQMVLVDGDCVVVVVRGGGSGGCAGRLSKAEFFRLGASQEVKVR